LSKKEDKSKREADIEAKRPYPNSN